MTTDLASDPALSNAQKAYRAKIGIVAGSPNFPSNWDQVVAKVKIADELGFASAWLGECHGT